MTDNPYGIPNWAPKEMLTPPAPIEYWTPAPLKQVYLAGPITGMTYDNARFGWREQFAELLSETPHIKVFSPMRGKEFLAGETNLAGTHDMYKDNPMATKKGITVRDRADVQNCDLMVANFLEAERVSLGTCIEFGWADAFRKPVIMITADDDPWHNQAMLHEIAGYVVPSLEFAARITKALLTPGI